MNKIFGYFLLCVGLVVIFFAATSMFNTFINKQPVTQLITTQKMTINTQQGPMEIDTAAMTSMINFALYGIFMFFIVAVGGRVIAAGTNLVKADAFAEALKNAKFDDIKKL